nr:hypothetical protein BaRGS_008216 [Batillaria attramentaria]
MSNNKKVHFAEGLPYIKGSGIPTANITNKLTTDDGDSEKPNDGRPETTKESSTRELDEKNEMFQPPWSAPVTSRSLATMTPRSKLFKPLPIPKIDIVSEIYDELIVKTIQTFLQK